MNRSKIGTGIRLLLVVGSAAVVAAVSPVVAEDVEAAAALPETEGYGRALWGMNLTQVQALYPEATNSDGSLVLVGARVAGLNSVLVFLFTEDRLARVGVMLHYDEAYVNANNNVRDYHQVDALLAKKYGISKSHGLTWTNGLYKDNPDRLGFAIELGHVTASHVWETGETKIEHVLQGEHYKTQHTIRYTSLRLARALEDEAEVVTLEDL